jgi:hypothetical protein
VKVDDLSVTEPAATSEPMTAITQSSPAAGEESATAVTQPIPVLASERCEQCSALLAPDQRYCLHCGAPRAHVNGPISGGRPGGAAPGTASSPQTTSLSGAPQSPPPGTPGAPPTTPPGFNSVSPAANRNNTLALLAGVGVLLLAMGVGVLIGRASAGTPKVPPAQVISVGGAAAGSSTTATTPSTPASETPAANSTKKTAKTKAASSPGTGSSINKPAPPTVLKSVSKGQSGSNYEQKSKNLPDVVETG